MIIFIDESGTHKQSGHAANAVVYVTLESNEQFEDQLKHIIERMDLGVFHWADHGWKVRDRFMQEIIKLEFKFKIGIFKNPVKMGEMTEKVFQYLITERNIERVWIDGKQPKWYERRLKKVLRDKGISVKKLRTVRDEQSQLGIQLADALAGLCRYYFDNPNAEDARKWFEKLKREEKLDAQVIF